MKTYWTGTDIEQSELAQLLLRTSLWLVKAARFVDDVPATIRYQVERKRFRNEVDIV